MAERFPIGRDLFRVVVLSRRRGANSLSECPENSEAPSGACVEVRVPSTALHVFVSTTSDSSVGPRLDSRGCLRSREGAFFFFFWSEVTSGSGLGCPSSACVCDPSAVLCPGSARRRGERRAVQPRLACLGNRGDGPQGEALGGGVRWVALQGRRRALKVPTSRRRCPRTRLTEGVYAAGGSKVHGMINREAKFVFAVGQMFCESSCARSQS